MVFVDGRKDLEKVQYRCAGCVLLDHTVGVFHLNHNITDI